MTPPVTSKSIADAKAQMLRERLDVMKETGVVIRPDGTLILPKVN